MIILVRHYLLSHDIIVFKNDKNDKNTFLDVKTATEMGIAVYTIGGPCTEEVADTTMCHILNLYRRVSHLNEAVKSGRKTRKIPVMTSIF